MRKLRPQKKWFEIEVVLGILGFLFPAQSTCHCTTQLSSINSWRSFFLIQVSSQHLREILLVPGWAGILFASLRRWWCNQSRSLLWEGKEGLGIWAQEFPSGMKHFPPAVPKAPNSVMEFVCRQLDRTLETEDEKRVSFFLFTEASQEPELQPGLWS